MGEADENNEMQTYEWNDLATMFQLVFVDEYIDLCLTGNSDRTGPLDIYLVEFGEALVYDRRWMRWRWPGDTWVTRRDIACVMKAVCPLPSPILALVMGHLKAVYACPHHALSHKWGDEFGYEPLFCQEAGLMEGDVPRANTCSCCCNGTPCSCSDNNSSSSSGNKSSC
jgi:hypothetical protein